MIRFTENPWGLCGAESFEGHQTARPGYCIRCEGPEDIGPPAIP